ncbi:MAG: polysaccharide deacetylase family protein [Aquificaceae bacterium]|nr:polysaccharide deacetylase family protein [Aquificaceae bacterium]MDW8237219.1 polysaccharide deacetylase family protein [Aquificaceae bacterium]
MVLFLLLLILPIFTHAGVINRLPTEEKVVAITLDACETKTPSYLDMGIIDYLVSNKIPFTLFVSGKFLLRNKEEIKKLHSSGLVSIHNHSMNHYLHMERLPASSVIKEVRDVEELIQNTIGQRPKYFRFPAGNYDEKTLKLVESMGYKVVHWTFPSGDPDRNITPERLASHVLEKTKPGSILIFHVNGRGYSTAKAMPKIIQELKKKGYRFVLIDDYIK